MNRISAVLAAERFPHAPLGTQDRSRRSARRLRRIGLSATLSVGALLAFAPGAFAFFGPETPESPNASATAELYYFTLVIALIIFVAVEGALVYALIKFRARKGVVAAQIRGNTRLELGWTLGAAAVLLVLAIATFVKLAAIQDPVNSLPSGAQLAGESGLLASATEKLPPNGRALHITVTGQQYIWRYTYPGAANPDGLGAPYAYENMVVPVGVTVVLDIQSLDVVHSWWIPQLGGKFQAIPGYNNYSWFRVDKAGTYRGQCAEICGRGHARMIAQVTAVSPTQFDAWIAYQKQAIAAANAQAAATRAKLNTLSGAAAVQVP